MDILTSLSEKSAYSNNTLQLIVGAWVLSTIAERGRGPILANGDVSEDDYDKQSLYSLLYAMYRSVGDVKSDNGELFEMTFNTWGYDWPESFGASPVPPNDPQRFGRNAYTGLHDFPALRAFVDARQGEVHIVELGSGTGAGAHHVCKHVWPKCTYEAIDMQAAAIETCRRKFVPELGGRLRATRADATELSTSSESADILAICETHVAEMPGVVTAEDERFFAAAVRILKPGGYLTWGNAIPDSTWAPCFAALERLGMERIEVRDVTKEAVRARDIDRPRVQLFVDACLNRFMAFKIPVFGPKKRRDAELALKNFYRDPGTNLYNNMVDGTDTYKVALFQKPAAS